LLVDFADARDAEDMTLEAFVRADGGTGPAPQRSGDVAPSAASDEEWFSQQLTQALLDERYEDEIRIQRDAMVGAGGAMASRD
jgi:hypothetical protein